MELMSSLKLLALIINEGIVEDKRIFLVWDVSGKDLMEEVAWQENKNVSVAKMI